MTWMMFPDCFVSVVASRHLEKIGQPIDPDRLVVRARMRGHLVALLDRHPDLLAGCTITGDSKRDYPWRFLASKPAFAEVVKLEVLSIRHPNFKAAAEVASKGSQYSAFLHRVWSEGLALQRPASQRRQHPERKWWERPADDHDEGGQGHEQ